MVFVLDRVIDIGSGEVTIQGKTDAGALVSVNGRQFRASAAGAFSASFPLAGTATIAVVGTSRPGFSRLLRLPAMPSAAKHVLPVMTFSYDGTSGTLGLAGKLIRKPAGAVKGYATDTETLRSTSFVVVDWVRGLIPCTALSGTCYSCAIRCQTLR